MHILQGCGGHMPDRNLHEYTGLSDRFFDFISIF